MQYLIYKENCYTNLTIKFPPQLTGADFFRILELMEFPLKPSDVVLFKYALTEFVTNSIRALREKNLLKDVLIEFVIAGNFVKCCITDFAGGFDLAKLPININDENINFDILSREFQEYRERHGYNRFGIGLCSARMALDAFRLVFIDENVCEVPWRGEGSVAGTKITAAKRISLEKPDLIQAAVVKREKRYSIFSKVFINGKTEAYLVDISPKGARILCLEENSFAEGQELEVKITNGINLAFRAEVRWLNRAGVFWQLGLAYKGCELEKNQAIKQFCQSLLEGATCFDGVVVIAGT